MGEEKQSPVRETLCTVSHTYKLMQSMEHENILNSVQEEQELKVPKLTEALAPIIMQVGKLQVELSVFTQF